MSNIEKLSSSSSLKDLVDRQELLTNNIEEQKNTLKEILISKNVEVADSENKLSILIQKVKELEDNRYLWLYKEGNECTTLTGGRKNMYTPPVLHAAAKNSNNLYAEVNNGSTPSNQYGWITTNTIDLTNYSKLYIDVEMLQGHNMYCAIRTSRDTIYRDSTGKFPDRIAYTENGEGVTGRRVLALDISSLNSSYYINFIVNNTKPESANPTKGCMYRCWLEK